MLSFFLLKVMKAIMYFIKKGLTFRPATCENTMEDFLIRVDSMQRIFQEGTEQGYNYKHNL